MDLNAVSTDETVIIIAVTPLRMAKIFNAEPTPRRYLSAAALLWFSFITHHPCGVRPQCSLLPPDGYNSVSLHDA